MFPSTLIKFSLCAILASAVGVNAQSAANVTCGGFNPAPVQNCTAVINTLRRINAFFPNDGGQANFTIAACMGKVQFHFLGGGIVASAFAEGLQPILDTCRVNDPMSGETHGLLGATTFQLFNPLLKDDRGATYLHQTPIAMA